MKKSLFLLASVALFAICLTSCEGTSGPSTTSVDGMLPGKFSVSESTKVHFSQGNLQFVEGTWKFAEHQWNCFEDVQGGDHLDLFCWGTGNHPNNVSGASSDYATYTEWGDNPITNGGNKAKMWRTLTGSEWMYLFCNRPNAEKLFGLGSINGINGVIILPDNWSLPSGVSFNACTSKDMWWNGFWGYQGRGDDHYADNTYTKEQWLVMEKAGAVFLPAAGQRNEYGILYFGEIGTYWSATPDNSSGKSCGLHFTSDNINPQWWDSWRYGRSVRLVR